MVNKFLEILREQMEYFWVFLQNMGFIISSIIFSNKPLQLQLHDQVNCLLLLHIQRIRRTYFLYYIVVFADDNGDLVFDISSETVLTSRWRSHVAFEFVDDGLVSQFLLFASYDLVTEFVDAFSLSEALPGAHLIFSHEIFRVLK